MSHFVACFGLPWALHSDNGRNLDGALIRHLARMLGVIKTSTPPHTPNANPTETMCGAVGMLLREALNASDQRYWSLALPFVLNALNSTVHTATGYTPNSLMFCRFEEPEPVPLVPFDCESANANEYYQKVRRFQELAFQIVRKRNERKLQSKREQWDKHARTHKYKLGDFVMVKNKNPADGPGQKKLRATYIGPFRVIKVYRSSLMVVPYSENSRLDEYYRDQNAFRILHKGDIPPFAVRQVSVKHCKPYTGDIEPVVVVDPIMLRKFLDMIGVAEEADVKSEIDSNRSSLTSSEQTALRGRLSHHPDDGNSDDTWGEDSDPGQGPGVVVPPPQPVEVHIEPPAGVEPAQPLVAVEPAQPLNPVDRLLENLEMSELNKDKLRRYYNYLMDEPDEADPEVRFALTPEQMEQLLRSPDPAARQRAQRELGEIMQWFDDNLTRNDADPEEGDSMEEDSDTDTLKSESESEAETEVASTSSSSSRTTVVTERQVDFDDAPDFVWDDDDLHTPAKLPIYKAGKQADHQQKTSTPMAASSHRGRDTAAVRDWVNASPNSPGPALTITRSGRVSRPPARLDMADEQLRQLELKQLQDSLNISRRENKSLGKKSKSKEDQSKSKSSEEVSNPKPSTSKGAKMVKKSKQCRQCRCCNDKK